VKRATDDAVRAHVARLNADLTARGSRWRVVLRKPSPGTPEALADEINLRAFVPLRWKLYPAARRALQECADARGVTVPVIYREIMDAAAYEVALAGPDNPEEPERHTRRLAALYAGRVTRPRWEVHAPRAAGAVPAADSDLLDQIIADAERAARLTRTAKPGTQERALVDLLLAGYTLAGAAQRLGVARATVDTMVHRLKRKAEGTPL